MSKILVVDDDPGIVWVIKQILSKAGHVVSTAQSGEAALEKLKTQRPDLILLDVMMPGLDGWETLEIIRKNPGLENIPVAMLTATPLTPEVAGRKDITELVDYIEKPFSQEMLISRVNYSIIEDLEEISRNRSRLSASGWDEKTMTEYETAARLERLHRSILSTLEDSLNRMGRFKRVEIEEAIEAQKKAIGVFRSIIEDVERRAFGSHTPLKDQAEEFNLI